MSTPENASQPASARRLRSDWQDDLPDERYRVTVDEAVKLAGNQHRLAVLIGISPSAITQWYPPYRMDKYMPVLSAMKLLRKQGMRERLQKMRME